MIQIHRAVKIVSYAITGFFVLIIVVSFGMPDFISRMGLDQSVVAIVNGEKVDRYDFLRYRDSRFGDMRGDKKMDEMVLSYYINDVLLLQEARKTGFYVTDDAVKEYIKNIPGLRDPATGSLNAERLNYFLERANFSFNDLQKTIRKDLLRERYFRFLRMGIAVPSDEVTAERIAANSTAQIKYSFISTIDLQAMLGEQARVTDAEVSAEMEKNKKEIKDPKTDRERIRKKLESSKLARMKKEIIDRVNAIALKGGSFEEAQAVLKGKVALSRIFKIGERVTDDRGQPLSSINRFKVIPRRIHGAWREQIIPGHKRRVRPLYLTPVLKNIKKEAPLGDEKDRAAIAVNGSSRKASGCYRET